MSELEPSCGVPLLRARDGVHMARRDRDVARDVKRIAVRIPRLAAGAPVLAVIRKCANRGKNTDHITRQPLIEGTLWRLRGHTTPISATSSGMRMHSTQNETSTADRPL